MRFLAPLLILMLSGCVASKQPVPVVSPTVMVGATGAVEVKGDAKVPGNVKTAKTDSVMTVPEGSTFEFNEKLGTMSLVISKATQIAVNRTETAVNGPTAFTPEEGPTVAEQSAAKSDFWTKLGLQACVVIGGAAAIFGLVKDWNLVMHGGVAVCVSGLFGLFVRAHPILLLFIGLGIALKFVGPIIWHTKLKNASPNDNE